jgi:MFS family permease
LPALSPSASDASAGRTPAPGPRATRRDRLLVPVAGLCLLIGTAAYLMVFTMLGQIAAALKVSGTLLGWIVIATIITGTLSAALFPALGAVVGQRRLMLAAMGLLAAGSVISATAPDGAVLLAGRIVAAPGFAASALSIAIVREQRSGPGLQGPSASSPPSRASPRAWGSPWGARSSRRHRATGARCSW